jgi:hypothetical protein
LPENPGRSVNDLEENKSNYFQKCNKKSPGKLDFLFKIPYIYRVTPLPYFTA